MADLGPAAWGFALGDAAADGLAEAASDAVAVGPIAAAWTGDDERAGDAEGSHGPAASITVKIKDCR